MLSILIFQVIIISMWWWGLCVSMCVWLSVSFSFSVWMYTFVKEVKWRKNGRSSVLDPSGYGYQYVMVCLWLCGRRYLSMKLNPETSGNVDKLAPWSDLWQYVEVLFFLLQCVDVDTCRNSCEVNPSSQYVVLKFFVFQCVDVPAFHVK